MYLLIISFYWFYCLFLYHVEGISEAVMELDQIFSLFLAKPCGTMGSSLLLIFTEKFAWWFGLINILEAATNKRILDYIQPREAQEASPWGELGDKESIEQVPFALSKHHRILVSPKGAVDSKKGNSCLWKCILIHSIRANKIILWTQKEFIDEIT